MAPYNLDFGEGKQVYYDRNNRVWVFPGEDQGERARPIGLPPTLLTTTSLAKSAPPTAPIPSNDPLAAMLLSLEVHTIGATVGTLASSCSHTLPTRSC